MSVLGGWGVAVSMEGVELGGGRWNAGAMACAVWGHALWAAVGRPLLASVQEVAS